MNQKIPPLYHLLQKGQKGILLARKPLLLHGHNEKRRHVIHSNRGLGERNSTYHFKETVVYENQVGVCSVGANDNY